MFRKVLLLGLYFFWVTGQPDQTEPVRCEIRVQACTNVSDDLNVGFIEVGTKRLRSWSCVDQSVSKRFKAAYVTGSCEYTALLPSLSTSSTNFNVVLDDIMELFQLVPEGAYFILVTAYSGLSFFTDVDSDGYKKYSTLLDDLHIELDEGDIASEGDIELYGTDEDGVIIVSRKGYPNEGTAKVVDQGDAPRLLVFPVRAAEKEFCIQPLTPIDSIRLDPRIYGQDDRYTQLLEDSQLEDLDLTTNGMHLVTSERIGCSHPVVGWEFIPANPTHVYFAIIRIGEYDEQDMDEGFARDIIGLTSVTITEDMITDDLEVQYKCQRPHSITGVEVGDQYMFYTDNSSASPENTPLKRVYIPPHTNARYPCSRQFTSSEAGVVDVFDIDVDNLYSNSTYEGRQVMNVALRPIMDPDFLYTCHCESDDECQKYGDPHMVCRLDQCVCNHGYIYNRHRNLCVYYEAARNATAYQSSVLGQLTENEADQAIDGDVRTDVLTGTCAKTQAGTNPWWLLDLGDTMEVYGIQIRTPEPLDVYLELWRDKDDLEDNPDAVLYKAEYLDVEDATGLTRVEAIAVHGPKPWIIKTSDESDVKILNTALTDGETIYLHDNADTSMNFGSVGTNIGKIIRIDDFGMFQRVGDGLCMYYMDPYIKTVSLDEGENCLDEVPESGEYLIVYMEESSGGTQDFYIRNIKDHLAVALNSFTEGSKAVLGSDKTTFRFYLNNADRNGGMSTSLASVLDSGAGVLIVPTNDQNKCLHQSGNFIVLGSSCTTKFYLKKRFDDTLPEYTYTLEDWTGSVDRTAPYLEVDLLDSSITPCYEIVRTTHNASDVGAAVTFIDSSNDPYIAVRDDDADITTRGTKVLMRANVVGIHDFVVGVSNRFDGTNFEAENFTTCASFEGAPVNGRLFRLDCEEPLRGRYVAVYMKTSNSEEKIQLCDFTVLTLSGAHSPIGDICYVNHECDYQGDDRKICDLDLHAFNNRGRCACAEGFHYHSHSTLCIDVDECLDRPAVCARGYSIDGVEPGECVNTVGSFYCHCEDGYKVEAHLDGYQCSDIDEREIDNCGCEGSCKNLYVDQHGFKYNCSCPEGYRLADDNHGCMDIDECEEELCKDLYNDFCKSDDCSSTVEPADCKNYPGSWECICPRGFEYGVSGTCTNVDECLEGGPGVTPDQGGCESECTDRNPKLDEGLLFECNCDDLEGYTLSVNQLTCVDIDECTQLPCDYVLDPLDAVKLRTDLLESGMCINTAGSFHCECRDGYSWHSVIDVCFDINECEEDHECEHFCKNTDTDYICHCRPGYELQLNNHSCDDINECMHPVCEDYDLQSNMEEGECVNTVGSYRCDCPRGYEWTCHHICACFDINECERDLDLCQYKCENRFVKTADVPFLCSCDEGWQLANDSRTCVDFDECEGPNICEGDGLAECKNSIGSFMCLCSTGYMFDKKDEKCADVDECDENNGGCTNECHNTVGSFDCHCPDGYDIDPNGRACIDVNECDCDPCRHNCFNNPGSFYCTCDTGYLPDPLDEHNCIDIDECSLKNGGCMHHCDNDIGSFLCSCMLGYTLMVDHASCDVHDECFNPDDNDCSHICINTFEGYECDCHKGYKLNTDKLTCDDLDECDMHNGECEQRCVNTGGSYYCDCDHGYQVGLNHKLCRDVDECDKNNGGCDHICLNTRGSFYCLCEGGQKIAEDEHKCVGENFFRARVTARMDWHPSYGDISTDFFKALQASLESNFRKICGEMAISNSFGSVMCQVVGPFKQGSVIFDLIVMTASPLTEADRAVLSYAITVSLEKNNNYLVIDGTSVPIEGKPQFIYTTPGGSGGAELIWTVDSVCAYYVETSYCRNGGSCEVDRGYPQCKCLEGYEGERCDLAATDDLTTTEVALISSVSVLGICVIFLMIISCWMCFKHMGEGNTVPGEDGEAGDDKSNNMARLPYFSGLNYWPYNNYA